MACDGFPSGLLSCLALVLAIFHSATVIFWIQDVDAAFRLFSPQLSSQYMVRLSRRIVASCLAIGLLACTGIARAQPSLESEVKAAYLYKFANFVQWPDGSFARADSVLQIGVAGNDALAEQLARVVEGRSVNGHAVVIRKVRRGESMAGLHIVFVGAQDRAAIVAELRDLVPGFQPRATDEPPTTEQHQAD